MSKTSTDRVRHTLNGPTMGTRWSAVIHAAGGFDIAAARQALQAAVDEVDAQMSTWRPDSDLMRLNRAAVGETVAVPPALLAVLTLALAIGRTSGGAFDIGVGDVVSAWGFGPDAAEPALIRAALAARRPPAFEAIELGSGTVRKLSPLRLDLNGIAKGYGVDRLAETLAGLGIDRGLVGIDGEMRAIASSDDDEGWTIAVEQPDPDRRAPHSRLWLAAGAVATSGDYRHWVEVQGRRLSHTVDPRRGAPLPDAPASVTVLAPTCAAADAWATALMVLGPENGGALAVRQGLDALFLLRGKDGRLRARGFGPVFALQQGNHS